MLSLKRSRAVSQIVADSYRRKSEGTGLSWAVPSGAPTIASRSTKWVETPLSFDCSFLIWCSEGCSGGRGENCGWE